MNGQKATIMAQVTLAPALGWPVGIIIAVVMIAMAVSTVVLYRRGQDGSSDVTRGSTIRRVLMCVLVAVMALTPSMTEFTRARAVNATDVVIATDVTGSMAVDDAHYGSADTISRLAAAQDAVNDLTQLYPNSNFTALHFGAKAATDVPLTPDTEAISNWADGLRAEATDQSAGSTLDTVLDPLLLTLKSIRSSHQHDTIVLYLITDGEHTSSKNRRSFSALRQYLDNSFTIGVGSKQGGNIPTITADPTGSGTDVSTGSWVTDPSTGQPGVSKMDAKELSAIADEMSGDTVFLDKNHKLDASDTVERSDDWNITEGATKHERLNPVVWPFAIAFALLLAYEMGVWLSTSRRLI